MSGIQRTLHSDQLRISDMEGQFDGLARTVGETIEMEEKEQG